MRDDNFSKGVIKLIGTHHLVEGSAIRKEIQDFKPDITLVELCNGRVTIIEHPELQVKERFSLLGLIVKAVRRKVEKEGKQYGSDMITAYKYSKDCKIPVGLIDRPMVETKVLFKAIPFNEKLKLLNELRKFKSKKVGVQDIISEVENSDIGEILKKFKKKCPSLFYYLVTSRDEYMINKIKAYLYDHPGKRIIIFVGEGHRKTIEESLKLNAEVVKGGNE